MSIDKFRPFSKCVGILNGCSQFLNIFLFPVNIVSLVKCIHYLASDRDRLWWIADRMTDYT